MNKLILVLFLLLSIKSFAQFPGAAGTIGTTAIPKDSSIFVAWANTCKVERGFQNISDPALGYATVGDSTMALGVAGSNGVVSLGDGGSAILTFQNPITNGTGFDFAVFENSFNDTFLELAFVEVSSDGINFFRFPAISNTQTITQIGPFDNTGDATQINNLAGKYSALYGTPFDLQELENVQGLDINAITHVKIMDVVGSINPLYASYDSNNNPINDPFPTSFPSSGFDLDAVGVIHQQATALDEFGAVNFSIYPNPISTSQTLEIISEDAINEIEIYATNGSILFKNKPNLLQFKNFSTGIYFIKIYTKKGIGYKKLIVQ